MTIQIRKRFWTTILAPPRMGYCSQSNDAPKNLFEGGKEKWLYKNWLKKCAHCWVTPVRVNDKVEKKPTEKVSEFSQKNKFFICTLFYSDNVGKMEENKNNGRLRCIFVWHVKPVGLPNISIAWDVGIYKFGAGNVALMQVFKISLKQLKL